MKKLIITEEEKLQIKKLYNIITEQTDNKACVEKYANLVNQAVKWWKNWLNNPQTEKKWTNLYVNKSSEINPQKHPYSWIKKQWFEALDKVKVITFDSNTKVLYDSQNKPVNYFEYSPGMGAFVNSKPFQDNSSDVYVNCDAKLNDSEMLNQILIHEIQHLLSNIFPLNDMTNINYKYYRYGPNDNGYLSATTEQDIIKEIGNKNFMGLKNLFGKNTLELYNRYMKESNEWEKSLQDNPGYTCSNDEKLSNLYSIRALLNISPNQQITSKLLLPYLTYQKEDNINITAFLLCWSERQFPPIDEYLKEFNDLALKDKGITNAV